MRNKLGITCMILGAVLVAAALSLFLWNRYEQDQADKAVLNLLPQVLEKIEDRASTEATEEAPGAETMETESNRLTWPFLPTETSKRMTEVEIDGYSYVGYFTIPDLGLQLPIMSDWSYAKLRKAPCRYYGDMYTDDLVILAHNYARHFGYLNQLEPGAIVIFTDMDGVSTRYAVAAIDVVSPGAVEEVTSGNYDLTLLTCTYGGRSRVVAWCDRCEE